MCGGLQAACARPAGPAAPGEMNHTPPAELDRVPCSPPLHTSAINHRAFLPSPEPLHLLFYGFNKKSRSFLSGCRATPPHPGSCVGCPGLSSCFRSSSSGLGWAWACACLHKSPLAPARPERGWSRGGESGEVSAEVSGGRGDENGFPHKWPWTRVWMDSWLRPCPSRIPGLWACRECRSRKTGVCALS